MGGVVKVIIGLLALVVLAALAFFAWLGGFSTVQTGTGTFQATEIVFATHRGPYEKIGETWRAFDERMKAAGVAACDGVALYLDPPEVEPGQLRSVIGCRIDDYSEDKQAALKSTFPHAILPEADAYTASFPFRHYASFILAPIKVYPAFERRSERRQETLLAIEDYGPRETMTDIAFYLPYGVSEADYAPVYDAF